MKNKAYRHGEILLKKIDKIPSGLKESNKKVFMVGSHGNNHSFDNGKLYLKEEENGVFGYLKAKGTSLFHPEHGGKDGESIKDGNYQLIKQVEYTPDGLVPVID